MVVGPATLKAGCLDAEMAATMADRKGGQRAYMKVAAMVILWGCSLVGE